MRIAHLHPLIASCALLGCDASADWVMGADKAHGSSLSWMGVYGEYQRHSGGNPGTFSVMMNQDYAGLHAELGYRVDGGAWQTVEMDYADHIDGNSLWQLVPDDAFEPGAEVDYYFHGWDDWGAEIWDSDHGANYGFTAGASSDVYALTASDALPAGSDLNQPLQVIFTPDDPALELELELIDQVRAARAADSASYTEGANPYTIRYAAYNLTHIDIADRLVLAHDEGVDVQVLVEADKIDLSDTGSAYHVLDAAGFEVVEDHATLDASTAVSADLVGIDDYGLMHLKARIYQTPDFSAMLTGSHNPQYSAMDNDETLHLVRDEDLIAEYQEAYDAILAGDDLENSWDDSAAVNVLFTPASVGVRAGTRIFDWIEEEDELVLLMVFALRDLTAEDHSDSLVDLLGAKVAEGVPVYVITDRKMSDGINADGSYWFSDDTTEDELRALGVPVFEVLNLTSDFTAMHTKAAVLGVTDTRVITDASNWSYSGLGSSSSLARNVESVLFIDTMALDEGLTGRRYLVKWLEVLARYEDQDTGETLSWDEVFTALSALSGWPVQEVDFEAHEAVTGWGEVISVRGEAEELGAWGPGVELDTDEASYPHWWTSAPVELPLGRCFGWKLTAGYPGADSVRWESGDDRLGCAGPDPLTGLPGQSRAATWGS
jgi:hypothetical protein